MWFLKFFSVTFFSVHYYCCCFSFVGFGFELGFDAYLGHKFMKNIVGMTMVFIIREICFLIHIV